MHEITLTELMRIMQECAGEAESVDLDGEVEDLEFEAMGYDSIALMETASRIEREYGITLDDEAVAEARTPRQFLRLLNEHHAAT